MTTDIAKKETFEQKMKARIIDSIGDLMPFEMQIKDRMGI